MSSAATATIVIFLILVVMLFIGAPIGMSLIISSLIIIVQSLGVAGAAPASALKMFQGINIFTLLAIPLFILAGNFMNKGGIASRLINFATALTGRIPGSLAHTNIVANMLFGAISGSGTAAASAMGSIVAPIEKEKGYDEDFSCAVNAATAPTGMLIPPSTAMITYSLASGGTSVAALFLGGYIPGILWGVSCMIVAFFYAKKFHYVSDERITCKQFFKYTIDAIPSLILVVIIIGGICSGVFTATEASGIAVLYSFLLSCYYRNLTIKDTFEILVNSAKMTGIIMFLVGASNIMAWVMSFTGIPDAIARGVLSISDSRIVIFLVINVLLLFVGTFMDLTPAILIFTPILLPVCEQLGMTALQFGIMLVFNLCIGCITPPVGSILFVSLKVANRKLENVMPILLKFYAAIFIILMLVTFVPAVSTVIPTMFGYM
jgi:tripartite ATP-independent transporter DctM subunit|uniref:TRAP transporter large permease n=1 Tax=Candidatus Ventrimonas sp. TaxID=3048889 RepID=UPI003FEE9660